MDIESAEYAEKLSLPSDWGLFRHIIEGSKAFRELTPQRAKERLEQLMSQSDSESWSYDIACSAYLFKCWDTLPMDSVQAILRDGRGRWLQKVAAGLSMHLYAKEAAWWCRGQYYLTSAARRVIFFAEGHALAIGGSAEINDWVVFEQEYEREGIWVTTDKQGLVKSMKHLDRHMYPCVIPPMTWPTKREILRYEPVSDVLQQEHAHP